MNEKQKFSACSQQKSSFTKHYKSIKPSDKGELQPKKKKKEEGRRRRLQTTDGREDKRISFSKLSPFFRKDTDLHLL